MAAPIPRLRAALAALAACGAASACGAAETSRAPAPAEGRRPAPADPPPATTPPAAAPVPGPAPAPRRRASSRRYLGDDFERLSPDRVRAARYGATRLSPEAEAPKVRMTRRVWPLSTAPELVVVEVRDDLVRVVIDEDNTRLLLWLERGDLFQVVKETTAVAPGPEQPPADGPGVTVYPGLPLLSGISDRRDELALIHYSEEARFSGWIAADDIGDIYVPVDLEDRAETEWFVAGGTRILDEPEGREVARLGMGRQSTHGVVLLGEEDGGHREIEFFGERFRVRGFVPASAVHPGAARSRSSFRSFGRLGAGVRPVPLADGTCFFDGPSGRIVGRVTSDSDFAVAESDGAWRQVTVTTRWGRIGVWIEDLEGGGQRGCD